MILNRQKQLEVNLAALRAYVGRLRDALRLGRREFNICFVNDRAISRLNAGFRGRSRPTDVLSFPWQEAGRRAGNGNAQLELKNYLGDVVISVEAARRNARAEGHSIENELRWLILHGLLHLLGYDHETDQGEMTALELSLRERLDRAGRSAKQARSRKPGARVG